jgi:ABC-2 type transport system ATP-binding protein/ribosome-dependent ATPase
MDEAEQADRLVLMSHGKVVAEGLLDEIIGDLTVVSVSADRWDRAFAALDDGKRLISLAGTRVRVLRESQKEVGEVLKAAGVEADLLIAPATLDETMVLLDS